MSTFKSNSIHSSNQVPLLGEAAAQPLPLQEAGQGPKQCLTPEAMLRDTLRLDHLLDSSANPLASIFSLPQRIRSYLEGEIRCRLSLPEEPKLFTENFHRAYDALASEPDRLLILGLSLAAGLFGSRGEADTKNLNLLGGEQTLELNGKSYTAKISSDAEIHINGKTWHLEGKGKNSLANFAVGKARWSAEEQQLTLEITGKVPFVAEVTRELTLNASQVEQLLQVLLNSEEPQSIGPMAAQGVEFVPGPVG
jgi:hypothetical protein